MLAWKLIRRHETARVTENARTGELLRASVGENQHRTNVGGGDQLRFDSHQRRQWWVDGHLSRMHLSSFSPQENQLNFIHTSFRLWFLESCFGRRRKRKTVSDWIVARRTKTFLSTRTIHTILLVFMISNEFFITARKKNLSLMNTKKKKKKKKKLLWLLILV